MKKYVLDTMSDLVRKDNRKSKKLRITHYMIKKMDD